MTRQNCYQMKSDASLQCEWDHHELTNQCCVRIGPYCGMGVDSSLAGVLLLDGCYLPHLSPFGGELFWRELAGEFDVVRQCAPL